MHNTTDGPSLIGRKDKFRQIIADLTKTTPNHVSIIGPRSSGKSVLVKAVCKHMAQPDSPYSAVIYWDLSTNPPETDDDFISEFARRLALGIRPIKPDYADYLTDADFPTILEVVQLLYGESIRVFMAWDGFDRPLIKGNYSANLWGNFNNLAEFPSWKVVTATRKPLQELISNQASWDSKFWGTFGRQVSVAVLSEEDFEETLLLYPDLTLEKSAKTEIANWTGLYPPLVLAFLESLKERASSKLVNGSNVNDIGALVAEEQGNLLSKLWKDCDQLAREVYLALLDAGDAVDAGPNSPVKALLQTMGLIQFSGAKIRNRSRLMAEFVRTHEDQASSLSVYFGTHEMFSKNQIAVLQLRLNQIDRVDSRLRRNIEICLEDLPEAPDQCMKRVRDIAERAIAILLECELGKDMQIPRNWIQEWQAQGGREHFLETGNCPHELAGKVQLLRLISNPRNGSPKAKQISPLSCELAQALKRLGDFGVHPKHEQFTVSIALSTVSMCIELAATVARDLHT